MSIVKVDSVIGSYLPIPVIEHATDFEVYTATAGQTVFTTTKFDRSNAIRAIAKSSGGAFSEVPATWTGANTVTITGTILGAGQIFYIFKVGTHASKIRIQDSTGAWVDLSAHAANVYTKAEDDGLLATKQPLDATLTALAALVIAANKLIYSTGVDTFAQADFTAFARTLLDDADAATMKSTLGVRETGTAFIEGLVPLWVSATSIQVNPGSAYITSLGRIITVPGALVLSGLTLTAATWYYLYLYDNAGTAAIELVTTAPTAPYAGFARTKNVGGGDSRRFLGAFRAQAANVLRPFIWAPDYVTYLDTGNLYPIMSNSTTVGPASVSASAAIPITTQRALLQVYSAAGNSFNLGVAFDQMLLSVTASTRVLAPVISTADQVFVYSHIGAVTGGTTLDVRGYGSER